MQRRYRMPRRSLVNFWLLLIATLCVDAVVFSWISTAAMPPPQYGMVALEALVIGELSVVCIWAAFRATKWSWVTVLIASLVATFATAAFAVRPMGFAEAFMGYLAPRGLHAAMLLVALWLLQRTPFWRRRTGTSHELKYSVAHLLLAMTVVAVLATTARLSPLLGAGIVIYLTFTCCNVALAVASSVVWTNAAYWLFRFAEVLGCAAFLAVVVVLMVANIVPRFPIGDAASTFGAFYFLQSILLSLWLGLGPILPLQVRPQPTAQ